MLPPVYEQLMAEIGKVIVGQRNAIEQLLIAFFSGGHVLLEGVPGTAKTLMAKAISAALDLDCKRIQFTSDLMPADIIGTNVLNLKTNEFAMCKGPIFTDVLLADEINRTPPKTQSALLEAMQEYQITIDGAACALPHEFFVIATQNPIEHEGTFPLPESQLDRFMMKILIDYPLPAEEANILRSHHAGLNTLDLREAGVEAVFGRGGIKQVKDHVRKVQVEDSIFDYIVNIISRTRRSHFLLWGASPRASVCLMNAAKAKAAIEGRDFVIPDDVKFLARPVLRHRIGLRPESEIEGITADEAISQILGSVEAPR